MHRQYDWEKPRNAQEIKTRQAYQMGCKLFKTIRAASRHEAWRLILDKYIGYMPEENPRLSGITSVHRLQCLCECEVDSNDCPLHDHQTGYFARLHARLSKAIELQYTNALADAARAERRLTLAVSQQTAMTRTRPWKN